jgi:hypothetical protein
VDKQATQARIAENQDRFRRANEQISAAARQLAFPGLVPFVCECADPACVDFVRLSLATYAQIRQNPRRFFVIPAHGCFAARAGAEVVVDRQPNIFVVEKFVDAERQAAQP